MTKIRDEIRYLNCIQKGLLLIIFSISFIPIVTAGNYTGDSSTCKACHETQYALWTNSTHTSKLITRDDAMARGYPNPPGGYSWENVSLVIGSKWKIRYVNDTGYIITTGGKNQFNVDDQIWTDYNKDTTKKYNCGHCHATGYLSNVNDTVKEPFRTLRNQGQLPDGVYDNSLTPGFKGYWAENSVGCEACHGNGGDHVLSPSTLNIRNASVVRNTPEICGDCHSRPLASKYGEYDDFKPYPDGVNDSLLSETLTDDSPMPTVNYSKTGGHHEQWEDLKASVHANNSVACANCHGGHAVSNPAYAGGPTGKTKFTNGSVYPAVVIQSCTDCHASELPKHGYYTVNSECISCHMPQNRKSSNKIDLRSHWFDANAMKNNKNTGVHALSFATLQNIDESCVTCHSSANLSKPIDTANAGVHKDINKSEGIGLLNSSDCKSCHYGASASSILSRNCDACHVDQVITSPKVDEHIDRSADVTVTASCTLCHNNSVNKFKYNNNASVSHYGTANSLINTSNCIDCHNGAYTGNASWGSPVNISTSTKRPHTETQTSQCDSCHKDSSVSTLAAVTFHNASVKTGLPPPVTQTIGLADTKFENVTTPTCKNCHPDPVDIHHAMVGGNANFGTPLGCLDCHPMTGPIGSEEMTIARVCQDCHNGGNFSANPIVNLTRLRGAPGRPHHNITKASVWNYAVDARYWAADRQCNNCHGSGIIADYNDGHVPPAYNLSLVTPFADFKLNATTGKGREYGGCAVCHDTGVVNGVTLNSNDDTHHYVKFWIGNQCNNCHVSYGSRAEPVPDYNPEPSANVLRVWFNESYPLYLRYGWDLSQRHVEIRNSTMLNAGDTINGTGCEKCHSMQSLHNIENNAAYNQANKIPGQGHIGNSTDCNGCHYGNALFLAETPPGLGASAIQLNGVTPGTVNANVATDVTIAGDNLAQAGYNTEVLIDGAAVAYSSLTETSVVVNVNLGSGGHSVQVRKTNVTIPTDTATSAVSSLSAIASPTITSAELASGVLTITGSAFGTDDMTSVVITKADGRKIIAATTSWSDTVIVADGANSAVGDSVTVLTKTGSATATIEAGVPPTLTTITISPSSATMKIGNTQIFTATALDQNGNPMQGITISWAGSSVNIGTVSPTSATTGSDGQATTTFDARARGTTIVSANSGSVSGSATVTVSPN